MPIRPEFRHFYGREWQKVIRPRILKRAGNKCEQCGVPNREIIVRHAEYPGWWFSINGEAHAPDGSDQGSVKGSEMPEPIFVHIKLGVAHLDHDPANNADGNLKALCARCHFMHDRGKHRETRSTRKDAARPLLQEARA